jgi:hypothetical protein
MVFKKIVLVAIARDWVGGSGSIVRTLIQGSGSVKNVTDPGHLRSNISAYHEGEKYFLGRGRYDSWTIHVGP